MAPREYAVLLYDDGCRFCRWAVCRILQRDRHESLRAVPLQAAEADAVLPEMDGSQRFASWHLIELDGQIQSGGAAVAPLLGHLPGLRWLGSVARALSSADMCLRGPQGMVGISRER